MVISADTAESLAIGANNGWSEYPDPSDFFRGSIGDAQRRDVVWLSRANGTVKKL